MTDGQQRQTISEEDVHGFGQKLAAWGDSLTPQEQVILGHLLRPAADAAEDDTQGYGFGIFFNPMAVQGFGEAGTGGDLQYILQHKRLAQLLQAINADTPGI